MNISSFGEIKQVFTLKEKDLIYFLNGPFILKIIFEMVECDVAKYDSQPKLEEKKKKGLYE